MGILDRLFRGRRLRTRLREMLADRRQEIEYELADIARRDAGMTEEEIAQAIEDGTLIDRLKEKLPELLEWLERIAKILALFM